MNDTESALRGLKRDLLSPDRYEYLSKEDSDLYDEAMEAANDGNIWAFRMARELVKKASASRTSHRNCKY